MKFYNMILLFMLFFLCCKEEVQATQTIEKNPWEKIGVPKTDIEIKLATEYQKRFGKAISNFELSTSIIYFTKVPFEKPYNLNYTFSLERTISGAYAKYLPEGLETELGVEEWLNFINTLYKCRIDKWENDSDEIGMFDLINGNAWGLEVISYEQFVSSGNKPPLNWHMFKKTMDDMIVKIRKGATARVAYYSEEELKKEIERAKTIYKEWFIRSAPDDWELEDRKILDTLRKAFETKNAYFTTREETLIKNKLNQIKADYEKRFKRTAPEWQGSSSVEKLNRLIRAIKVNVPYLTKKEEKELEIKLKANYKDKFGKTISNFELSTSIVYFGTWQSCILALRTATGAILKYHPECRYANDIKPIGKEFTSKSLEMVTLDSTYKSNGWLEKKLNIGEWLGFVNTLYKFRIDKWIKRYTSYENDTQFCDDRWRLEILSSDTDEFNKFYGHNACPQNWDKFKIVMDNMETKVKQYNASK